MNCFIYDHHPATLINKHCGITLFEGVWMRLKTYLLVTVCFDIHVGWLTCPGSVCSVSCSCPQK